MNELAAQARQKGYKLGKKGSYYLDPFKGGFPKGCKDMSNLDNRICAYEYEMGYVLGRAEYLEEHGKSDILDLTLRQRTERTKYILPARALGKKAYIDGLSKVAVLNLDVYNLLPGSNHPANKLIYDEWEDAYNEAEADPTIISARKDEYDAFRAQQLVDMYDAEAELGEFDPEKKALDSYSHIAEILHRCEDDEYIKCITCPVLYESNYGTLKKSLNEDVVNCELNCGECRDYLERSFGWHLNSIRQFIYGGH